MKSLKHTVIGALLIAALLTLPAGAAEITVDPTTQFTFSAEDFVTSEADLGIFLTAVPRSTVADLCLGNRVLRAGDALNRDALDQLYLQTSCMTPQDVSVEYCTIDETGLSGTKSLRLSILPRKNEAPTAEDSELETYKNIANSGELEASDPEDDDLIFHLVDAPKRGTVELDEDGSFTYTPDKNKVGKDSFTFTVTDEAGNTSAPAKVRIQIKKPTDKSTYADLQGDPDTFTAMWMREQGLYAGDTVGGNLCFSPDETVSRGEFLVMTMKLVDAKASETTVSSGFADADSTPVWLQPYLTTALRNGMITGISAEEGLVFQASSDMTKAEAAVMLQNILQLPANETQAVFSADTDAVPVWAAQAASALSQAGVDLQFHTEGELLTRRDAAKLLYAVNRLMEQEAVSTFYWVQ